MAVLDEVILPAAFALGFYALVLVTTPWRDKWREDRQKRRREREANGGSS